MKTFDDMMNVAERLGAYLEGNLNPADAAAVERLIDGDGELANLVGEIELVDIDPTDDVMADHPDFDWDHTPLDNIMTDDLVTDLTINDDDDGDIEDIGTVDPDAEVTIDDQDDDEVVADEVTVDEADSADIDEAIADDDIDDVDDTAENFPDDMATGDTATDSIDPLDAMDHLDVAADDIAADA